MKDSLKVSNSTIEKYSNKDFIWLNDIIESPSKTFYNTGEIQFDQREVHSMSCFIHGPAGCVSDITGYKFTTEELLEITNEAWTTEFADPRWGGFFNYGVKAVCKFYNEKHSSRDQHLSYYRLPHNKFNEALDRGYSVVAGYHTSKNFSADRNDDGIINQSKGEYSDTAGGHCVRLTKKDGKVFVINNYFDHHKHNIFEIEDLEQEIKDGRFFKNGYIVVIKEDVLDGWEGLELDQKIKRLSDRAETIKNRK